MEPTRISGPQGSQGAQGTQSARGKSQTQQAGGPVDPSAQGGFLALLASLDGTLPGDGLPLDTESDSSASQTAIMGSDNAVAIGRADPASLAAWQSLLAPGAQPGAAASGSVAAGDGGMSALAGTDWHAAADGLEAQKAISRTAATGFTVATGNGGAVPGGGAMTGLSGMAGSDWLAAADGLVAQTALQDGAAEAAGAKPPNGAAVGYGRIFSRHHNALSQGRGDVSGVVSAAAAGANGAEKKQALVTAFSAMQGTQAVVDSRVVGGPLAEAGSRGGSNLLGDLGGAAGAPALDLFAESRLSQRGGSATSGDAGGRPSADAAWGSSGTVPAGPETAGLEGAAVFADPTLAGAEEQIADQVAYWVNQKTQNAEMTLDRDGQPVQVTVSLSGSEAHVTFRSDQAQTRELLDSSMAQLRDLLHNEGLVLAGTTVGTTARDGASPNDSGQRQGRGGERRAQVVASVPSAAVTARHNGGASDRAVDIFV